jgi:hypothetical protein
MLPRNKLPVKYSWCLGTYKNLDKPRHLKVFDKVLYKDQIGLPRLADAKCPHEQASLSSGKIVGDCIRCPGHGGIVNPIKYEDTDAFDIGNFVWTLGHKDPPENPIKDYSWDETIIVDGNWIDWILHFTSLQEEDNKSAKIFVKKNSVVYSSLVENSEYFFPNTIIHKYNDTVQYITVTPIDSKNTMISYSTNNRFSFKINPCNQNNIYYFLCVQELSDIFEKELCMTIINE